MIAYQYSNPTQIEFGPGSIQKLPAKFQALDGKNVMIVTDKGIVSAGILDKITTVLKNAGMDFAVFDDVKTDPSTDIVENIFTMFKEAESDCILAIGGGSPIDAAKGVSLLSKNPGKLQDYAGVGKVLFKGLPLIAVPTTAGTGSEVTIFAVLSDLAANVKFTITSLLIAPDVALLDPELTLTLPASITAATGLDAMTHAVEAHTSLISQPMTDALALEAMRLLYRYLPEAVNCGSSLPARTMVLQGALMAGVAFNNAFLGLSHAIASPLGAHFHVPHGMANAVMLPYVMEYNYIAAPEKYAAISRAMGVCITDGDIYENAYKAVETMKKFVKLCGLPCHLRDVGAHEETLDQVAEDAMLSVQLRFNCRSTTPKQIRDILAQAF
jgi:alcohol dehydrogenase